MPVDLETSLTLSSVEETSKKFSCSVCKRKYSSYKTLKQHANRKHPVRRGAASLKNGEKRHFVCYLSGFYVSKVKGRRHLKTQGSSKIDGYCPAEIKVFVSETGARNIRFCKTHLEHRNDIGHLSLTEFEPRHIA
ncbi:hypothetical protein NPIL_127641, partial [Nephila pilipes]